MWIDLTRTFGPSASAEGHRQGKNLPSIATITEKRFSVGRRNFLLHKQEVNFVTHSGTHLDAFSHFIEGAQTIDTIPLEKLCGTGVVLAPTKERSDPITERELRRCTPTVRPRDIVLIHTGWDEKYGADEYFRHPYLAEDAAMWLAERRVKLGGNRHTYARGAAFC